MKRKLIPILLMIAGALVLLSSQAIAAPQSLEAKKTPSAEKNEPGSVAAQKAEEKALRKLEREAAKEMLKVKKENFRGTISAVDAGSLTLLLKDGSVEVFAINENTRLSMPTFKAATLADFEPGRKVKVRAVRAEDDTLTALSVSLIPGKPVKKYRVGIVTEYAPGVSITIQAKNDQLFTYLLTENTRILPTEREELLQAGAKVTIISPRDLTKINQTALKIVVHPESDGEADDDPEPEPTEEPTVEPTEEP